MRAVKALLALGILALAGIIACALAARLLFPPPAPPEWANDYDLTVAPPETIAPGTVVGESAPAGWSHLVIKSLPRVKPGEVARVPGFPLIGSDRTVRMVAWMFTVFTADVVKEQHGGRTRHRLRAIGLGLGTNVGGRDTVITVDTAKEFGAEMDWIKNEVLRTGYRIQGQALVPVHGPSFALLDTPVIVRCTGGNRMVRYRYALLADTSTGALDVMLWRLVAPADECGDPTRAVWLEPNCIDAAELVPDLNEFQGAKPSDVAFAVDKFPPHRLEMAFPPALVPLTGKTKFTPDEAAALEAGLRAMTAEIRP